METDQLRSLLTLGNIPGMGPARIRTAVSTFKSPRGVFEASFNDLCQLKGINMKLARNILDFSRTDSADIQMEKAAESGAHIITLWDDSYPPLLNKIYDAPVFLYLKGSVENLNNDAVAVVGTRKGTPYGKRVATELGEGLASAGLTVVSGLASGIDTVAHKAALSVGGLTMAVLGNGLDTVYPSANRQLTKNIEKNGTIISEFPFGTKPDASNFPKRNRIISGLSHATVVVEAGDRSGAILTALDAVDQNRDLFAVAGRLTDPKSLGCLRLIRNGAIPYHTVQHLLDILNPRLSKPLTSVQKEMDLHLTKEEKKLFSKVTTDPKHVDDIVTAAGSDPSTVLTLLLELELKGAVLQLSGKHYVRA